MTIGNCFNCDRPVPLCICETTETFEIDDGPVCPHCGHQNRASDSDGLLYDESTTEYDCGECSRTFSVSVGIRYSWNASK